jgi:hypothetical protein
MNKWRYVAGVCIAALLWAVPIVSQAAEEPEEITSSNEVASDNGRADDWFTKPKEAGRIINQSENEAKKQETKEKQRYIYLFEDNGFVYYLDNQNVKWKPIPYSETEEILDIWIKLIKVAPDEEYSYPQKYFLEHYYLRPDRKQIQFLSELEVTGRPDNAIKERPYSVHNWENIVSGSLEDEIYHSVLKVVKKNEQFWPKHKSVRDVLEDIFRISL